MSIKHFKEYYKEMSLQHKEMLAELEEFQELASKNMIDPDVVANFKESMQPLLDNYQTMSWVAFLLNKPNATKKQAKYHRQYQPMIDKLDKSKDLDSMVKTNEQVLDNLQKQVNDLAKVD